MIRELTDSTFQEAYYTIIFFSEWRLLIFSGGNHPRHLWRLTLLPTEWDTPDFFFIKMIAKDVL